MIDEADLAFHAPLNGRRQQRWVVERARRNRHAVRRLVGQGRAAIAAEAAADEIRRPKGLALPSGPLELHPARGNQRRIIGTECLLAHAAMTDRRILKDACGTEADRPTLAAAGI